VYRVEGPDREQSEREGTYARIIGWKIVWRHFEVSQRRGGLLLGHVVLWSALTPTE
jgi:hypothetical protein